MVSNKVVIITGAAKGIGKAAALKFAADNFCVTLVDINKEELANTGCLINKNYGNNYMLCEGDIGDDIFLQQIIKQTIEKWGRIDVLVNNAAWRTIESMRTIEIETWEKTLKRCLTAPAFLAKWCAAKMEELKIPGVVINISSMMAERPAGNSPAYIAAKGAMNSLTKELAVTYGRNGIRVAGIQPGYINTEMSKDYADTSGNSVVDQMTNYLVCATPLARGGTAEEIADAIYWLSSDAASFITGTSLLIDGGFKHNLNEYAIKKLQFPNEF